MKSSLDGSSKTEMAFSPARLMRFSQVLWISLQNAFVMAHLLQNFLMNKLEQRLIFSTKNAQYRFISEEILKKLPSEFKTRTQIPCFVLATRKLSYGVYKLIWHALVPIILHENRCHFNATENSLNYPSVVQRNTRGE